MPEVSILDLPNVLRGNRATRATSFPVYEGGEETERACLLVPLTGTEEAEALSFAVKYAKEHSAAELKAGDPLFDLGFMARALTLGVRTPEGGPMFGSVGDVLDALPRETLVYVHSLLEAWQDSCSPSVRRMTDDAMREGMALLAAGGPEADRFLGRLSLGVLHTLLRFSARLFSLSPAPKSPTFSPSTTTTTSSLKPLARAKKRGKTR